MQGFLVIFLYLVWISLCSSLFWDIIVRRWNLQFCNFDPKAFSGFQGCALRKFEGAQLTEPVKSRVPNLWLQLQKLQFLVTCKQK